MMVLFKIMLIISLIAFLCWLNGAVFLFIRTTFKRSIGVLFALSLVALCVLIADYIIIFEVLSRLI